MKGNELLPHLRSRSPEYWIKKTGDDSYITGEYEYSVKNTIDLPVLKSKTRQNSQRVSSSPHHLQSEVLRENNIRPYTEGSIYRRTNIDVRMLVSEKRKVDPDLGHRGIKGKFATADATQGGKDSSTLLPIRTNALGKFKSNNELIIESLLLSTLAQASILNKPEKFKRPLQASTSGIVLKSEPIQFEEAWENHLKPKPIDYSAPDYAKSTVTQSRGVILKHSPVTHWNIKLPS